MRFSIVLLVAGIAAAQDVVIQTIAYHQDSTALEGKLVAPATANVRLPGIVLFPDWMGMSPQATAYAKRVAEWGYAVFVADIYGKGAQPKSSDEASKLSGAFKGNVLLLRQRAAAALVTLKLQPGVDTENVGALGFCFGGMGALELARSGASLKGIVSVHGNLSTPLPKDAGNIRGKVLVLQGAEDHFATPAQAQAFMDEMRHAGLDWQVMFYGGAVHAFTNPGAGSDPRKGVAYDAKADRRAFSLMKDFFMEAL